MDQLLIVKLASDIEVGDVVALARGDIPGLRVKEVTGDFAKVEVELVLESEGGTKTRKFKAHELVVLLKR